MLKHLALAVLFLFALAPTLMAQTPTVVIVVRHAEKADSSADPALSDDGVARSKKLAEIAEQAGVQAVFTTQLKRTKQTAKAFLTSHTNITPREFQLTSANLATHPRAVADEIRQNQRGRTILVIGHSNTAPRIVNELTGQNFADLDDPREFDAIFFVLIPQTGPARAVKAKYGKAIDLAP